MNEDILFYAYWKYPVFGIFMHDRKRDMPLNLDQNVTFKSAYMTLQFQLSIYVFEKIE